MLDRKIKFIFLFFSIFTNSFAQKIDNPSNSIDFKIVHTRLELSPLWNTSQLKSKAVLTVLPYFYGQDTLRLDAKGFTIESPIKINNIATTAYTYDNAQITISLGKMYSASDTLKIEINYLANPNNIVVKGSSAIVSDKGLYFINPKNEEKNIPRQFWTQGETQANSCWFPTIDSPNQKHSQDVFIKIENDFTTLSNGLLVNQTKNSDGTRTDHWQQKQSHSIYLTMIAAGQFTKVVDPNFKDIEVSYYLEPKYAAHANGIFGRTPEMIRFYENLLGVKYPWAKYAQIPVRKYVSGAMENSTATVHGKTVLKNNNQLIDGNDDGVIAHELFHHWFGNMVTCESWSNLPLNESFANYSEYLWAAHKSGKDEADFVYVNALTDYLNEANEKRESLIRYNYADKEDMFDAHSYQKGGRVLHMLRQEVGDKAFFKALNYYLEKNKWQNTEVDHLRQAFEAVTGRDMRWFFNQWFLNPGHPTVNIETKIKGKKVEINANQVIDSLQKMVYNLQIPVTFIQKGKKTERFLRMTKESQTFEIELDTDIDRAYFNANGYFLGTIIEGEKSKKQYIQQYQDSLSYYSKIFALEYLLIPEKEGVNPIQDTDVRNVFLSALKDPFWRIRQFAVQKFFDYDGEEFLKIEKSLQQIIKNDPKSNVRADGILAVKNFLNPQNELLFRDALKDTSYLVRAAGLEALFANNVPDSKDLALKYETIDDINIFSSVANYNSTSSDPSKMNWYIERIKSLEGIEIYQVMALFGSYLSLLKIEEQGPALQFLKDIALNSNEWFVKLSAAQALNVLKLDNKEAEAILKEVISKEKNPRLIGIYEQIKE
jgi:aminopeptidase N